MSHLCLLEVNYRGGLTYRLIAMGTMRVQITY